MLSAHSSRKSLACSSAVLTAPRVDSIPFPDTRRNDPEAIIFVILSVAARSFAITRNRAFAISGRDAKSKNLSCNFSPRCSAASSSIDSQPQLSTFDSQLPIARRSANSRRMRTYTKRGRGGMMSHISRFTLKSSVLESPLLQSQCGQHRQHGQAPR